MVQCKVYGTMTSMPAASDRSFDLYSFEDRYKRLLELIRRYNPDVFVMM